MDIDQLTIAQARELIALFGTGTPVPENPYKIGAAYLIRTVTYHMTGIVRRVTANEIVLDDAAWIGDSGRFAAAVISADFSEVDAVPGIEVIVGRGAITDAWPIPYAPKVTK